LNSTLKLVANENQIATIKTEYKKGHIDAGDAKEILKECLREEFGGILDNRGYWRSRLGELENILQAGALRVQEEVKEVLFMIRGSR